MALVKPVTTKQLSTVLAITVERIGQLLADGYLKSVGKNGKGKNASHLWDRDETIKAYISYLRADGRKLNKTAAENRVREARAAEIEMRTAVRAGRLVDHDAALGYAEGLAGLIRTELSGLPARVTRDLVLRKAIGAAIDESLSRIAEQCKKRAAELQTNSGAAPTNRARRRRLMSEGMPARELLLSAFFARGWRRNALRPPKNVCMI